MQKTNAYTILPPEHYYIVQRRFPTESPVTPLATKSRVLVKGTRHKVQIYKYQFLSIDDI